MRIARFGLLIGIAASALVLGSCTTSEVVPRPTESASPSPIRILKVAADNSDQSQILANLYVGALNAVGQAAEVYSLNTSDLLIPAVESNDAQIVGESITGATEFLDTQLRGVDASPAESAAPADAVSSDLDAAMNDLRDLASHKGLTVLNPAEATDETAFAVRKALAKTNTLKTLSDLADYSQDSPLAAGGPAECRLDPFCLPSLEDTYGVKVRSFLNLNAGGFETAGALEDGRIDVGVFGSFDSVLDEPGLVVVIDDKDVQPAGNMVPILNDQATLPLVSTTLNDVSAQLRTTDLRALNYSVEAGQQTPADVADAWLALNGLA